MFLNNRLKKYWFWLWSCFLRLQNAVYHNIDVFCFCILLLLLGNKPHNHHRWAHFWKTCLRLGCKTHLKMRKFDIVLFNDITYFLPPGNTVYLFTRFIAHAISRYFFCCEQVNFNEENQTYTPTLKRTVPGSYTFSLQHKHHQTWQLVCGWQLLEREKHVEWNLNQNTFLIQLFSK